MKISYLLSLTSLLFIGCESNKKIISNNQQSMVQSSQEIIGLLKDIEKKGNYKLLELSRLRWRNGREVKSVQYQLTFLSENGTKFNAVYAINSNRWIVEPPAISENKKTNIPVLILAIERCITEFEKNDDLLNDYSLLKAYKKSESSYLRIFSFLEQKGHSDSNNLLIRIGYGPKGNGVLGGGAIFEYQPRNGKISYKFTL